MLALVAILTGCTPVATTETPVRVILIVDGQSRELDGSAGMLVSQLLQQAGISLGSLDRVEPSQNSFVQAGQTVRVIRVREEFNVEKETIPFEQKMVKTESLPDQVTLLAQKGENGVREMTYRHLMEDGVEVSKTPVNEGVVIKEAIPEIIMVGVQKPFSAYSIPGRIAFLLGGNAWIMEGTTSNRKPIINTGDLDGRIFSLSPDGQWLLFTRREDKEGQINSLWAAPLTDLDQAVKLINLNVTNVVHSAEWYPNTSGQSIVFTTVEPRTTAPGWQANNDLQMINFSASGWTSKWKTLIDSNSGGVYGWWGSTFSVDPYSGQIGFARPDSIGIVDEEGQQTSLVNLIPYQTHSDWAWVPGLSWSPDGAFLYSVSHVAEAGAASPEESPDFSLSTIPIDQGSAFNLVSQTGIFANPVPSTLQSQPDESGGYQVAFLQAILPEQSETSRYRLTVMDQDGSNQGVIFPNEGEPGLEPQKVAWSPEAMPDSGSYAVALVYQGNLYLVDSRRDINGAILIRQITGDGLVNKVVWSDKD